MEPSSPFEFLAWMWSGYDEKELRRVFEACGNDVEKAMSELFISEEKYRLEFGEGESFDEPFDGGNASYQEDWSAPSSQQQSSRPSPARRPNGAPAEIDTSTTVCKYFLQGQCFRADCWYSHDPKSVTCKFWIYGDCMKGNRCEFRHAYEEETQPPPQPTNLATHQRQPNFFGSTSGDDSSSSIQEDLPPWAPLTFAARLRYQKIEEEYKQLVDPTTLYEIFRSAGCNSEKSRRLLNQTYPDLAVRMRELHDELNQKERERKEKEKKEREQREKQARKQTQQQLQHLQLGKDDATGRWVQTGEDVKGLYLQLREQAIEHAKVRNKIFARSTAAYLAGDKATATRLSKEGRTHHDKMKELHAKAGEAIFWARNKDFEASNTLDLHGLHIEEVCLLHYSILFLVLKAFPKIGTLCSPKVSHRGDS